jgi:hypothetical protein
LRDDQTPRPVLRRDAVELSGLRQANPVNANALAPPAQQGGVEVVVHGHGDAGVPQLPAAKADEYRA